MADINPSLISEDVLRQISRSLRTICSKEPTSVLQKRLEDLIKTSRSPEISVPHHVSACNVTCGFLEQCLDSQNPTIRSIVLADSVWRNLFAMYLNSFERAKPKSMKQVLNTLVRLILAVGSSSDTCQPRDDAIITLFDILCTQHEQHKGKAALLALTYFLTKSLVTSRDLLDAFQTRYCEVDSQHSASSPSVLTLFLANVFAWITLRDTASAAGTFVQAFLHRGQPIASPSLVSVEYNEDDAYGAPWAEAIHLTLRYYPDLMHPFQTHIFPCLFSSGMTEFLSYLKYLRFEHHLGCFTKSTPPLQATPLDLLTWRLLAAAVCTGNELGLARVVGTFSSTFFRNRTNACSSRLLVGKPD